MRENMTRTQPPVRVVTVWLTGYNLAPSNARSPVRAQEKSSLRWSRPEQTLKRGDVRQTSVCRLLMARLRTRDKLKFVGRF